MKDESFDVRLWRSCENCGRFHGDTQQGEKYERFVPDVAPSLSYVCEKCGSKK